MTKIKQKYNTQFDEKGVTTKMRPKVSFVTSKTKDDINNFELRNYNRKIFLFLSQK